MSGDEQRRLRRLVATWSVVGVLLGLTVWYAFRPAELPALEAPVAPRAASPASGGVPAADGVAATVAGGTTASAVTSTGPARTPRGPTVVVTQTVASGAGTVVSAAVNATQQAQARDHWTPDTMANATPVAVTGPSPNTPPAASASTARSTAPTAAAPAPSLSTLPLAPATSAVPSPSFQGATVAPSTVTGTASTPDAPEPAASGSTWSGGGAVTRTVGKVFFTRAGRDYVCSAAALATPDASTVITAAHCIVDQGVFASRWVFAPGWAGASPPPYGLFAATHFAVPDAYLSDDVTADVAFVNVARNAAGQTLTAAVGGLEPAFGSTPSRVHVFGYPQATPFDGTQLVHCSGAASTDRRGTSDLGVVCGLTGGASGGPWLADFDATSGAGRVVSVTSFGYRDEPGTLYGPRLGGIAQALFASVSSREDL